MFSGSISEDAFVSYIKLAQLKLSIRNSSTEQEAKVAHPVSPLARLIHPLLLDLSEAESNNELWPQYYFTKEERRLICTAVLKSTKCTESLQTIWIDKTHWQMSWNTFPTTYSVTVVIVFATYSIVQLYPRQQRIKLVWERSGLSQTMLVFFGDLHSSFDISFYPGWILWIKIVLLDSTRIEEWGWRPLIIESYCRSGKAVKNVRLRISFWFSGFFRLLLVCNHSSIFQVCTLSTHLNTGNSGVYSHLYNRCVFRP